jgi:Dolichyl-phosphate-mannose-protein mannosyltransferase
MIKYADNANPSNTVLKKRFVLRQWLVSDNAFLLCLALIKLGIHFATSANYGFFRDELYYIDAGKHLAAGYVEFPSFIALLAACIHSLFGDVLVAYHVLPALAGATVVVLSGLMARELGGKRFAQSLAAIASLVALTFLGINSLFSMDSFDELFWVLAAYVLILLIKRDQPRYWLLFGLIAGIGLTNKITILMFGFAIVVGILLTPNRKYLWNRWTLLGGALALVFLLPYVIWNAQHGWATLEFWSTYSNGHANPASAGDFFYQQVLTMNPLTLPLWLAGLYYYFTRAGKPYRVFAWAFLILYVLFTITHAKLYFLSPAYPALFAGGAIVVERVLQNRRWLKVTYIALLLLAGFILAPLAMPILPPALYASTMGFINGDAGIKVEDRTTGQLPQQLADRFGWDTMTATIARVYHGLPANEQAQACIFAANYGEAGAIDLYGPLYHLPSAISGHNSYYLWGPGNCSGKVIISIGVSSNQLQAVFKSVTQASINTCQYCMPAENNLPIYIARDPKASIHNIWLGVKHYD